MRSSPARTRPFALSEPDGLPLLDATPGHLVRCAQQVHGNLWTGELGAGLTSAQFAVLLDVGRSPGVDQRTVGSRVSLDKSTAADVVARLAHRGLVTRGRGDDGRRRALRLTDDGTALLVRAAPGVVRVQHALLAPLAATGRRPFLDVLRAVAYRGDPPAPETRSGGEDRASVPLMPQLRLHDAPGHLVRRAQQVHTALWADRVPGELSSVQYNILLVLHHNPDVDQRTLGEHASLDKSTGGELLGRMVARGLVQRRRDVRDGRRNLLRTAPAGEALLFAGAPAVLDVQAQLLEPLDADGQRLLMMLLGQLVRAHLPPQPGTEPRGSDG